MKLIKITVMLMCFAVMDLAFSQEGFKPAKQTPYMITKANIMVEDLQEAVTFYQQMLGMKVISGSPEERGEVVLGFGDGSSVNTVLGLISPDPSEEESLEKSEWPVVVIMVADFEAMLERLRAADVKLNFMEMEGAEGPPMAVGAQDPSGNWLEIFAKPGASEISSPKIIVDDLAVAEEFYTQVFGSTIMGHFEYPNVFNEAFVGFGEGPGLALYGPYEKSTLEKSKYPVLRLVTKQAEVLVDALKEHSADYKIIDIDEGGLPVALLIKDPSGNQIEVIVK